MLPKEVRDLIIERIRKLKLKYLKKSYEKYFARLPENCTHNYQQKAYRKANGQVLVDPDTRKPIKVGLCMIGISDPTNWKGDLCHLPEIAQRCPVFKEKYNKQQIEAQLEAELKDPQLRAEKYKDINELFLLLSEEEHIFSFKGLLNPGDFFDLFSFDSSALLKLQEQVDSEIVLRNSEKTMSPEEMEFTLDYDYFNSLSLEDLRKVAQYLVGLISQRNDPTFDKEKLEKEIWEDVKEVKKDLFENGL